MERESFEDEEVAALLNEHFVSVKVDREERPDVDHLYMSVCQSMTGQGGWPLTVILTPDKKPFFAGTYFPKTRKYGRYGLMDLLPQLAEKWRDERDKIEEIGEQIVEETKRQLLSNLDGELNAESLDRAYRQYAQLYDETFGGFGSAPKFPSAHNLSLLLRYYKRTGETRALEMVERSLDGMYRGGLYDHIGFGFARYSTDDKWLVPHFEKMLYDNALLAIAYTEAYQATEKPLYAEVAEHIFAYVLRDMTDPEGGFYSAEDADSEGVEGKFYVWKPDEVAEALGVDDGELFCELYDITEEGNFEGHSIPNLIGQVPETFAVRKGMSAAELNVKRKAWREKLFAYREKRVRPHKDDKILTSWNGLMIAALAKGAKVLGHPAYAEAAAKAESFLWTKLRREDGRLLARYRDGEAAFPGYADDYAYLLWGLIELYEATFEPDYLRKATSLARDMLRLFWDEERGGLFFYGQDAEQLLARMKETYDGAMPSGNSVAAYNLQRLAKYVYDAELAQKADELLQAFAGAAERYPSGHAMLLTALDFAVSPPTEIVIAGDPDHPVARRMLESVRSRFMPNAVVILVPNGERGDRVRETIPLVRDKAAIGGRPTAYVCENFACLSPTDDPEELEELLGE
ncbi:thioredoxin domain-containing protein [Paenibacillus flagellatus]|uniref:thioredoxin domain-containing protein n=1 Tax=Paenibacillus flagellatus TaxID=2211139 RepID=UPI00319E9B25